MAKTEKPKRVLKKDRFVYPDSELLLDMDGVWANFAQRVIDEYNKRHNGTLHISQWTKFEVSQVFGDEIWALMEKIYNEPGFFASIEPYPGSLEIVREVCKLVPVTVCSTPTKRINTAGNKELNPHCAFEKFEWVHKHMPELSNSIILANAKHKIKADFLVDDGMHNIAQWCYAHRNGTGFVVARPWNEGNKLPRNAVRAPLEELPEFIRTKLT